MDSVILKLMSWPYSLLLAFLLLVFLIIFVWMMIVVLRQGRGLKIGPIRLEPSARKKENDSQYQLEPKQEGMSYQKILYVKVLHLRRRKDGSPGIYKRRLAEVGNPEIDVSDEALYFSLHIFSKPRKMFRWAVRSSGKADPQIIHPWTEQILYPDQKERLLANFLNPTCRESSSVYLAVSHFYNGLQPGEEELILRVEEDIDYARLIADFSSVANPRPVFLAHPKAYLTTTQGEFTLGIAEIKPMIFSAFQNGIKEGQALRITYRLDWEAMESQDSKKGNLDL